MLSTQLNETDWMCVFDMLIHCSVAVEADLFSKQKCFVSVLFESNTSSHLNISLSLSLLPGSSSLHRSPQAEGVPASHHLPEEPPEVRADGRRSEEDLHAEVHQDRRQSPH